MTPRVPTDPPITRSEHDNRRSVTFHTGIPMLTPPSDQAWAEWFDRMGLDTYQIPVGSTITCHDDTCRIEYTRFLLTEKGTKQLADPEEHGMGWAKQRVFAQLEGPALPFPRHNPDEETS